MFFSNGTVFRIALSLVLVLSVFSGTVVQASNNAPAPPSPASASSIAIQTYGVLPVMLVNLTQSPIDFNVTTTQNQVYAQGQFPIAAGLSGVYFPQNGAVNFTNIADPAGTQGLSSLMPFILNPSASSYNTNTGDSYVNLFTLFPSWSGNSSSPFAGTAYSALGSGGSVNLNNSGAVVTSFNQTAAYPVYPKTVTANAQSMSGTSECDINFTIKANNNGQNINAQYQVAIKSLGGSTSGTTPTSSGFSVGSLIESALGVWDLVDWVMSPNLLDMAWAAYDSTSIMGAQSNSNDAPNVAYSAKYNGINASAKAISTQYPFVSTAGDDNALFYTTANSGPLALQNSFTVTSWRKVPVGNGVSQPLSSADLLIVIIVNNGIAASSQLQQYINTPSLQPATSQVRQKPTKAQAEDALKILGILSAIEKSDPSDAQYIIDMFGTKNNYRKLKGDSIALKNLNISLIKILEKHKNESPNINGYLTKLEQK